MHIALAIRAVLPFWWRRDLRRASPASSLCAIATSELGGATSPERGSSKDSSSYTRSFRDWAVVDYRSCARIAV